MFANLHRRDQDPLDLQVQRHLTVGETIKSKRVDTCVNVVRGQLIIEGDATAHIGEQCIDMTSDVVALHGIIAGNADPDAVRYANFGLAPAAATSIVQTVKIPYAAEIVAITVEYLHTTTAFTAALPLDENSLTFSIGSIPVGSAHSEALFAANLLSSGVVVFDNDENATHPSASVTGLSVAVPAGSQIGVSATLVGTVGAAIADYSVTLWLRGVYA